MACAPPLCPNCCVQPCGATALGTPEVDGADGAHFDFNPEMIQALELAASSSSDGGSPAYNDFDIILGPFLTHHESFTTLHAPRDVLYLVTMVI